MDFHTQWKESLHKDLNDIYWDFEPVVGFQDHACEPISVLLQRYAAGDPAVWNDSEMPIGEKMFEDDFELADRYARQEELERSNAESSGSGRRADPRYSSQANSPGDSDIALGQQSSSTVSGTDQSLTSSVESNSTD